MSDDNNSFPFPVNDSIKEMEKEMAVQEKKDADANLEQIKERNKKARIIIQRFNTPIEAEVDDIVFMLKPISVSSWDRIEGDRENPSAQSEVVRDCLLSPELSEEEFKLLPAGIKYKLFMFLLQDFFLIAGKVQRKAPPSS